MAKAKKIQGIKDLTPDPANVNRGTERGNFQLDWSMTNLGAGRSILADADGVVLAGNQTLHVAADHGLPIRVIETDGHELVVVQRTDLRLGGNDKERERARQIAIADNRISETNYAEDAEMLLTHKASGVDISPMYREDEIAALMKTVSRANRDEFDFLADVGANDEQQSEPRPVAADFKGVYALREGVIFPASNKWGIPDLLADKLSDQIPAQVWGGGEVEDPNSLFIWHTAKFKEAARGGVLGFYVDDWRFESVWNDSVGMAEDFKDFGWGSLISPDFSVWRDDPAAVQLWNIYRSRWVARYWQEVGLRVIPSLNWSDERSQEFAHLGIPKDCPVVSVQCRTTKSRVGKEFFGKGLSRAIEELTPQNVLIYGGAEHRQWLEPLLPEGVDYHWLESWTSLRRQRIFNKEKKQ